MKTRFQTLNVMLVTGLMSLYFGHAFCIHIVCSVMHCVQTLETYAINGECLETSPVNLYKNYQINHTLFISSSLHDNEKCF